MIVFDEYEYALELENQNIDSSYNVIKKGIILAKYYFYQGYSEDEVYKKLCQKFIVLDNGGNYDIKHAKINIMIASAKSNPELKRSNINFSEYELNLIHSIKDEKLEIFMFVMLCIFKFNNNNKFYVNEREILRMCNLYWCGSLFNSMVMFLYDKGYLKIGISKLKGVTSQKIVYEFSDEFKKGDSPSLIIKDYRNLNYQYLKYFDKDKYINCENCGITIPKKNNRQKYCNECK